MGETLVLRSINGHRLTDKLINSWLDTNEIFVTKTIFSEDRCSVEITFVDEDRAEMVSDLLTTCYGDCISIEHPRTLMESLNHSSDDERLPSPVDQSSIASISSKVSLFSQRLVALDKKNTNDDTRFGIGRGRKLDKNSSQINMLKPNKMKHDENDSLMNIQDTTSITSSSRNISMTSGFGRGRYPLLK